MAKLLYEYAAIAEWDVSTRQANARRKLSPPGSRLADQAFCHSAPRAGGAGVRPPVVPEVRLPRSSFPERRVKRLPKAPEGC
jgi:hypothetical protein